jgi:hypothetical protein
MITEHQKLECVKFAKNLAVKMQSYEAAAMLRDFEKSSLGKLHPDKKLSSKSGTFEPLYEDLKLESFNIEQLHFLNELIKKSFKNDAVDIITEIIELRRGRALKDILE